MEKRKQQKRYTPEFKKHVILTMREEGLSYNETMRRFGLTGHHQVQDWERIYLTEGFEGLGIDGRKRRPANVEEDLIAEVQRLRAENAYLKNLQALVLENERHPQKKHR